MEQRKNGKFYLVGPDGKIDPGYIAVFIDGTMSTIPAESVDLAERKRMLDRMTDEADDIHAALYDAIALDFDAVGQTIVADACRMRAARLMARANAAPYVAPTLED